MIVYTKPDCPNCIQLKQYLANKSIPYKTIELDFGQETDNELITIEEFKSQYPTVSAMPLWTHGTETGGLAMAKRLF